MVFVGVKMNAVNAAQIKADVAELNKHVGTPEVEKYKSMVHLPKGWHLDFGIHSGKYVVVDHMGARVL